MNNNIFNYSNFDSEGNLLPNNYYENSYRKKYKMDIEGNIKFNNLKTNLNTTITESINKYNNSKNRSTCCMIPIEKNKELLIATQDSNQTNPIRTNGKINFSNVLTHLGNSIKHDNNEFIINETGIYQIYYRFDYLENVAGELVFELSNFLCSRSVEVIKKNIIQRTNGTVEKIFRILLPENTKLYLIFLGTNVSTIDSVLINNAVIGIEKLYSVNVDCALMPDLQICEGYIKNELIP